jgi:hypothetical protein
VINKVVGETCFSEGALTVPQKFTGMAASKAGVLELALIQMTKLSDVTTIFL